MLNIRDVSTYLNGLKPFGEIAFVWRNGQQEAIIEALQALDDYNQEKEGAFPTLELSAPTSAGKSVILWAFAKAAIHFKLLRRVVITTPQKILIKQYLQENNWFDGVVLGRGNYPCALDHTIRADACTCKSPASRKAHDECDKCEYEAAKRRFKDAKIALTTFAYYQAGYHPEGVDENGLGEGLIIDESSNLEGNLLDRFALKVPTVTDSFHGYLDYLAEKGSKEDLNNPEELTTLLADYILILTPEIKQLDSDLEALADDMSPEGRNQKIYLAKEVQFRERELYKCQNILHYIADGEQYFVNAERQFKLVFGKRLYKRLEKSVRFTILASGTPTTHLLSREYNRVEMAHPIPVKNRRFIIKGIGQMSLKARAKTIPLIAKEIAALHAKHGNGQHTIVHCHSYQIAEDVAQLLRHQTSANVILQDRIEGRETSLARWMNTPDSIFCSVKFTEGLNLKGSKYVLNIIIKVPFAYLGDEWTKIRNAQDNGEYTTTEAAVAIQQAAGRTTRDPKDFSLVVCLDSDINWWLKRNQQYFEGWFLDSVERQTA